MKRISNKGLKIKIPMMGLSESLMVISRDFDGDDKERLIQELSGALDGEIEVCPVARNRLGEFASLIREIKAADRSIDATDIILIACSIIDQECKGFLTFDGDILTSRISELLSVHVSPRRRFRIVDTFS